MESAVEHFPQSSVAEVDRAGERMRLANPETLTLVASVGRAAQLQILPKALFLEELRHERSRSDRTQSPLSMVILQLAVDVTPSGHDVKLVTHLLQTGLRETDSVSFLQNRDLVLLLPDTNDAAAKVLVDRVSLGSGGLIESISIATYPDKLFETLDMSVKNGQCSGFALMPDVSGSKPVQSVVKRGLDILGAIVGLLVLSPFLLIVVAAIKLSSPGPAIFRQIRLGKDFKPFTFYKFRSMYVNADDKVHRDFLANLVTGKVDVGDAGTDGKTIYKIKADSRVTPLGRLLRKTSIDELPQLVNVLRGDMSLVGPRPPIPYETENYQAWHLRRIFTVKPGLTGLWQVEGRSNTTFDEMVRLDIQYSCNWSIWLDLKLLFRTIKVVLECRGAV